jgi:hypothetical protein
LTKLFFFIRLSKRTLKLKFREDFQMNFESLLNVSTYKNYLSKNKIRIVLFTPFVISFIGFSINFFDFSWQDMQLVRGYPKVFAEIVRVGKTIGQPMNYWSCLAYVWQGIYILLETHRVFALRDRIHSGGPINKHYFYGYLFGTLTILLGIGSAFFHASLTQLGGFMDAASMLLGATFLLVYTIARRKNWNLTKFSFSFFGLAILLIVCKCYWPDVYFTRYSGYTLVGISMGIEFFFPNEAKMDRPHLHAVLSSFAIGLFFWITDDQLALWFGLACGHALWHLFTARCIKEAFLFYRSEKP